MEVKALLKVKLLIVSGFIRLHIFTCFGMIFALCVYNGENVVHFNLCFLEYIYYVIYKIFLGKCITNSKKVG